MEVFYLKTTLLQQKSFPF